MLMLLMGLARYVFFVSPSFFLAEFFSFFFFLLIQLFNISGEASEKNVKQKSKFMIFNLQSNNNILVMISIF